jgi:parallel beta-helix repeat protein
MLTRAIFAAFASAPFLLGAAQEERLNTSSNPQARTLHVANNGMDIPTCGARASPCRSISQAHALALEGDTILVGPGRYGDLNRDGDFNDPGDEQSDGCVVCLSRPGIRVLSEQGAAVTLIDATGTRFTDAVAIISRDMQFGSPGHGFRVLAIGGPLYGISVSDNSSSIRVAGNVVTGGTQGAYLFPTIGRAVVVDDNIAIDTVDGPGFVGLPNVIVPGSGERTLVVKNIAVRNRVGFSVGGLDTVFVGNIADDNVQGAFLSGSGSGIVVRNNSISGSRSGGVLLDGIVKAFADNDVLGNGDAGVAVSFQSSVGEITGNNIYGNGLSESLNCGLLNATRTTVVARNNFWGLPSGPGADPADAVCNVETSVTVVQPVAGRPFRRLRRAPF